MGRTLFRAHDRRDRAPGADCVGADPTAGEAAVLQLAQATTTPGTGRVADQCRIDPAPSSIPPGADPAARRPQALPEAAAAGAWTTQRHGRRASARPDDEAMVPQLRARRHPRGDPQPRDRARHQLHDRSAHRGPGDDPDDREDLATRPLPALQPDPAPATASPPSSRATSTTILPVAEAKTRAIIPARRGARAARGATTPSSSRSSQLRHVAAEEMANILQPFVTPGGDVLSYPRANADRRHRHRLERAAAARARRHVRHRRLPEPARARLQGEGGRSGRSSRTSSSTLLAPYGVTATGEGEAGLSLVPLTRLERDRRVRDRPHRVRHESTAGSRCSTSRPTRRRAGRRSSTTSRTRRRPTSAAVLNELFGGESGPGGGGGGRSPRGAARRRRALRRGRRAAGPGGIGGRNRRGGAAAGPAAAWRRRRARRRGGATRDGSGRRSRNRPAAVRRRRQAREAAAVVAAASRAASRAARRRPARRPGAAGTARTGARRLAAGRVWRTAGRPGRPAPAPSGPPRIFKEEVRIVADEVTNSLVILATKRDYQLIVDVAEAHRRRARARSCSR